MNLTRHTRVITAAALATASWGVLALGSVHPWAYWPLMWGALLTGLLGIGGGRRLRDALGHPLSVGVAVLSVAMVLQLVPLAPAVMAAASPSTRAFVQDYLQVPDEAVALATDGADGAGGATAAHPISLRPRATLTALAFTLTLGLMVVGGLSGLGVQEAQRLAAGLLVLGIVVALVAIVQRSVGDGQIYGLWAPRFSDHAFGPFVNRNHFAGWMVMAISVGLGYLMAISSRALRGIEGWRNRVLWLSSPRASGILLVGLALAVMGLSLVLTASRSGLGCFVVSLLIVGACAMRRRGSAGPAWSRRLVTVGYLAGLALVTVWAGLPAVEARYAHSNTDTPFSIGGRVELWSDALEVIRRFPVTGTGVNTYTAVTPFFKTAAVPTSDEAHSDYLQLAAEGGALVGLPIIGLVAIFAREVRRRFRAGRPSPTGYWLRVGAVAGLLAIAAQELVDFSLQLPGNAVMFAALCMIAVHTPDEM